MFSEDTWNDGHSAGLTQGKLEASIALQQKRAEIETVLKAARRRAILGYRCEEIIDSLELEIEHIFDNK